jgi:hypothetical protein
MSNFINKNFRKNQSIKAYIHYKDRRVKLFWLIPNGNMVTVKGDTFIINDKDFVLSKGIPTYYYVNGTPEPMNLYKQPMNDLMTSQDFNVALEANVARQIFEASGSKIEGIIPILISVAIVGLLGYMMYSFGEQLTLIMEMIADIQQKLHDLGGF